MVSRGATRATVMLVALLVLGTALHSLAFEGVAVTGHTIIAVANDNDFAQGTPPATPAATPISANSTPVAVEIINDRYTPRSVSISTGTSVRWVNRDGVTHTVSSVDDHFDSGIMRRGSIFTATFDAPGTYRYGCDLHLEMHGTVVVR